MAQADIEKRLALLEKAEKEYKVKKEMLQDALNNDPDLDSLEEKAKDAKKRALAAKEALQNEPENRKLVEELKETAIEIRDTKKLLANELLAYFMTNKSLEYTDSKGQVRRISLSAKFVKGEVED